MHSLSSELHNQLSRSVHWWCTCARSASPWQWSTQGNPQIPSSILLDICWQLAVMDLVIANWNRVELGVQCRLYRLDLRFLRRYAAGHLFRIFSCLCQPLFSPLRLIQNRIEHSICWRLTVLRFLTSFASRFAFLLRASSSSWPVRGKSNMKLQPSSEETEDGKEKEGNRAKYAGDIPCRGLWPRPRLEPAALRLAHYCLRMEAFLRSEKIDVQHGRWE